MENNIRANKDRYSISMIDDENMIREEQIKKAAIEATGESEIIVDYDNSYHCCNCEGYDDYAIAHAFADGARWADENPIMKEQKIDLEETEKYVNLASHYAGECGRLSVVVDRLNREIENYKRKNSYQEGFNSGKIEEREIILKWLKDNAYKYLEDDFINTEELIEDYKKICG